MKERLAKANAFFRDVCQGDSAQDLAILLVTHIVPGRQVFIDAVNSIGRVAGIIPKPSSIHHPSLAELSQRYPIINLTRKDCLNTQLVAAQINAKAEKDERLIIMDMGGYFAENLASVQSLIHATLKGVVEDTENGHQRYVKHQPSPCPVISVARSQLKEPEDFLVGQSVVFSVDALLRQIGELLTNKVALVLGYGKLGKSIADLLSRKNIRTIVYDIDPIRQVQACSHGYAKLELQKALEVADVIFSATGNKALTNGMFARLKKGCFLATVTSADDELDIRSLVANYKSHYVSDYVERWEHNDGSHHFFILNKGNAVNFVHHAEVGPYIYLIQAELLRAVQLLAKEDFDNGVQNLDQKEQNRIALMWLSAFVDS